MIYGDPPENLGHLDLPTSEMMFWLYCPVSVPGKGYFVPDNLVQFYPLLERVWERERALCRESYIYLTAKTFYVAPGQSPNRPGWHADGFGTDDVNYIWYDRAPTEFYEDSFTLPPECADAMEVMQERSKKAQIVTYPPKSLLRLTPSVIHRVNPICEPGMRTFMKVSISKDRYNLEGNSVNHHLPEQWESVPRQAERNHPASK